VLFVHFQVPHGELWNKSKAVNEVIKLDSCKTQANRFFSVRCTVCGRHVRGGYGIYSSPEEKMHAMDALCLFFGVQPCSERTEKSGCHVMRKEAMAISELQDV
jgi:hypothetical protein